MGSKTEKKLLTNLRTRYKKMKKQVKSDNFYYCKVERAVIRGRAIEKRPILQTQCLKNLQLDGTIFIAYFEGTNNIFVDYRIGSNLLNIKNLVL